MSDQITITPIATIHSCFTEKFGIPRQAGLAPEASAEIHFFPEYARDEMFRGLEQFSHIWVYFLFHETVASGWHPTVRPPGLGGQMRVGVFASRSPHRPNHLGFSAVVLKSIGHTADGPVLHVRGGDFLNGTPVIDIKPYIPYSDALPKALSGYSGRMQEELTVGFSDEAALFCEQYMIQTGRCLRELIDQVVRNDPRPACQHGRKRAFGMLLWDVNIRWCVENGGVVVESCSFAE